MTSGRRSEVSTPESPAGRFSGLAAVLALAAFLLGRKVAFPADPVDGSWVYALGVMPGNGQYLGVDSFFTYGPLAGLLTAGPGSYAHLPAVFAAWFILALVLYFLLAELLSRTSSRYDRAAIAVAAVAVWCWGPDLEMFAVLVMLLLVFNGYWRHFDGWGWRLGLMVLAVAGMLYKFSLGVHALALLIWSLTAAVAAATPPRRRTVWRCLGTLAAYGVLLAAGFWMLTGFGAPSGIFTYLRLGMETVGLYSEIMAMQLQSSWLYPAAAVYGLAALAAVMLPFRLRYGWRGRESLWVLPSFALSFFILFKHGMVRTDHKWLFFLPVSLLAAAALSQSGISVRWWRRGLLPTAAALMLLPLLLRSSGSSPARLWSRLTARLELAGRDWTVWLPSVREAENHRLKALVKRDYPGVTAFLSRLGLEEKAGVEVSCYPFQLLIPAGVERANLRATPSLQLYSSGPKSMVMELEKRFLSGPRAPGAVVFCDGAIDGGNPLTLATDLFPVLIGHYQVVEAADGAVVMVPRAEPRERRQRTGPAGRMLRVRLDWRPGLLWQLGKLLLKAPAADLVISCRYRNGATARLVFRAHVSQLLRGVLFSPYSVPRLLRYYAPGPGVTPEALPEMVGAEGRLVRREMGQGGFPWLPAELPLRLELIDWQ